MINVGLITKVCFELYLKTEKSPVNEDFEYYLSKKPFLHPAPLLKLTIYKKDFQIFPRLFLRFFLCGPPMVGINLFDHHL